MTRSVQRIPATWPGVALPGLSQGAPELSEGT